MQLAAASEAEAGKGEAEKREGGGFEITSVHTLRWRGIPGVSDGALRVRLREFPRRANAMYSCHGIGRVARSVGRGEERPMSDFEGSVGVVLGGSAPCLPSDRLLRQRVSW